MLKMAPKVMSQLPDGWNDEFNFMPETQKRGDDFVRRRKNLILRVPSAVVKGEYNFLINPKHPDADNIKVISVDDFPFDKILFSMQSN